MKRIAIVGPECTGKTSLSKALASHYQTQWVPEFARQYLDQLNRPYVQEDLLTIAKGQLDSEDVLAKQSNRVLICDTNLIVIKVWSEFKYGTCAEDILDLLNNRHYALHLLTHVDIPWVDDPLREHPYEREELFSIYKAELEKSTTPFANIYGDTASRTALAIEAIDRVLHL